MQMQLILYFVFGDKVEAAPMLLCKQFKPINYLFDGFGVLLRGRHFHNDGLHVPFAHISFVPVDNNAQFIVRPGFIVIVYLSVEQNAIP